MDSPSTASTLAPEDLIEHADTLFRYAVTRIRNHHTAEDLVQDTLVTAINKRHDFHHDSSLTTWLIGILKNKILHHLRQSRRWAETNNEQNADPTDQIFDKFGSWTIDPNAADDLWRQPDQKASKHELYQALWTCVSGLPVSLHQLYTLREVDNLTVETIAEELNITTNSIYVLLHRARTLLKICLESGYYLNHAR